MQINKDYIKLNKNLILSFVSSATISALVAQLLADQEAYLNTTYTIMIGYTVFFSAFTILFYFDFRKKYGILFRKNKSKLKKELLRLITSLGIGEIFYLIIRWSTQYYFLSISFEPYLASLVSEAISTISYMMIVTLSGKITGLFKETN